ncbi:MAG: gamma-glutamyltransferase family protein [Roseinatronobacter sp.]
MSPALTTPHPAATAIGMAVLHRGGTASEALVAAGAALSVVMPHFCGLGGDAVWLVHDRHGPRHCFLAIGQGFDQPRPDAPIPLRGPASIRTSAALVDGWQTAFNHAKVRLGGRMQWHDLIAPAVALARDGYKVTPSQAFWGKFRQSDVAAWHGFAPIFTDHGRPFEEGHLLRQPALAETLACIAERGAAGFYHGPLAGRITDGLRAAGVCTSTEDLARTSTRITTPLVLRYRALDLLAPPPPTQGLTTLQIMGILSRFDIAGVAPGGVDHLHLCVEAVKQAFLLRDQIADPAFVEQGAQDHVSEGLLDRLAAQITRHDAMPWPHEWQHGDTVFLGAIDAQGNAASVLQSIYFDWGSGVVAGDTGILWQNRGAAFSSDPASRNAFAPGKLPFYTLTPGIALKDGRAHMAFGTQGADGQPQTLAMLLTRLIDHGQSPEEALAAPRFLLGRTFSNRQHSLKLEEDAGHKVIDGLRARGHEVAVIPARSPIAGQAGLVLSGAQGAQAWHDPRA